MRIGVIGLGNIGGAVAANLVEDGHDVWVFDLDAARVAELADRGARAAAGVAEVAAAAEVTFLSLPSPAVVEAVADEWLRAAAEDSVLVDLSTNAPHAVRALGEKVAAGGSHLLEAPLTGGAPGARRRLLVFLVGGPDAVFERCRPLLEKLGRAVYHFGPLGTGNTAKLVNSLLAFTATWVSLEGLALAASAGLDLRKLVDAVRTGGASNFFVDRMVEGLDQRGRPPGFALGLAAKDAGLIDDAMARQGVPAPVAEAVAGVFRAAAASGLGERDWSDVVEYLEAGSGQRLVLGPADA